MIHSIINFLRGDIYGDWEEEYPIVVSENKNDDDNDDNEPTSYSETIPINIPADRGRDNNSEVVEVINPLQEAYNMLRTDMILGSFGG